MEKRVSLRNKESRTFLERLWHLENEERPAFMIGYVGPKVKGGFSVKSALFSTEGSDTVRDRLLNPDRYLSAQLNEIKDQCKLKGEYVPSLCPALGVIGIASAFGCEIVWWENDFPSAKPVIGDNPEQIYDIKKPKITEGELGRILKYSRFFIEDTNGKYPLRLTDIQGPLDNASLIMGHNNLLMAMLSNPQEVHYLMKMITELMIDFIKAQRNIAYQANVEFVPSMFQPWLPDGFGISVSNDDWVMISADMHDEFHVPYLNQLSEEFGGLYIHSCGNWQHQFSSLKKLHKLRGIEFGASETPFESVLNEFNGKIVVACRVGFNRDIKFHGISDYVNRILHAKKSNRGLFINVDVTNGLIDDDWDVTDLNEIYHLLGPK